MMEQSWQQRELQIGNWPAFMPSLEPELSECDVTRIEAPDVCVQTPGGVDYKRFGEWSGVWSGWGSKGRTVDVKLIVEQIEGLSATITCCFLSGTAGQLTEQIEAGFEGEILAGTLRSGASIQFRLRHRDAMEFVWRSSDAVWMSGVLSRTDVNSRVCYERIPLTTATSLNEEQLEAIVFKPRGEGPFPTLIFNHGACGTGTDPKALKHSWTSPPLARVFTERGYMVIFPQRRGRGKSDGHYAEGLEPDSSGYSMRPELVLPGFQRALEDVDAVVQWVRTCKDVDISHLLLGGQSRGGLLSLAFASSCPGTFKGVLNFVGGWIGESAPSAAIVDERTFGPCTDYDGKSLWIYAESDSYYSTSHSRKNFETYIDAGGKGEFVVVHPSGSQDGHYVVFVPSLWEAAVDQYLSSL